MTLRVHPDEIVRESTSPLLAAHASWERVRLGEVAEILNGFAFKSANFNAAGEGTSLVRIRDVGQPRATTWFAGEFDQRYLIDDGDLLVGMDGDFRSARWRGGPALLNQRVCKITVRRPDVMSTSFLEYVLPGYLEEVGRHTSAITVKHLSSTTLAELPLPLPPRCEQERIVAAIDEQFSRLDAADASLRSLRARLPTWRRSLLRAIFSGPWPTERLVDVTDEGRPICYGILMPKEHVEDGVPYVKVKDFPKDTILIDQLGRTAQAIAEKYRRSTLAPGDVLISIRGTYGRVAIVPDVLAGANITQDTARITPRAGVDSRYLAHALRSDQTQRFLRKVARGVAVKGVNISDLRQLPCPIPSLEEQVEIVAVVEEQLSRLDTAVVSTERASRRSAHLRRAILSEAFSGRLVPQDPADEPASELLSRIAAERADQPKTRRRQRA